MGWFQELINARLVNDETLLNEAFVDLSSSVMGKRVAYESLHGSREQIQAAIASIFRYYRMTPGEVPEGIDDVGGQLEHMLRPAGILKRTVHLEGAWYRDSIGPLLGILDDHVVALIPDGFSGYTFTDPGSGRRTRVTGRNAKSIGRDAFCFYRPLPQKPLAAKDLLAYMVKSLTLADALYFAGAVLITTLLGLLTPAINSMIFARVIPAGQMGPLLSVMVTLLCVTLAISLIDICKRMVQARITSKVKISAEAAFMGRILVLPTGFFKQHTAGDLAERTNAVGTLCTLLTDSLLSVGLTALFSLLYVAQIFIYTPSLAVAALVIILLTLGVSLAVIRMQSRQTRERLAGSAQTYSMVYELLGGIQKIKLVGAENRAFAQWSHRYAKVASIDFDPPFLLKAESAITGVITLLGTVAMYLLAARSQVALADFMAFSSAYGMVSGAVLALSGAAASLAAVSPILELLSPILTAVPEVSEEKRPVDRLSGNIELNNVSFRYQENMPMVIDNLSLRIRKGQYIGIVGKTGCGKSTLIRLLLGFEEPLLGSVYYDGKDLKQLDVKAVRRNIGVVMQNGKLMQGSIFENIVISAPWLKIEDAWEAAELAGLADDIRAMPMGMFTLISEGGGGFSGGQKQRLMIARAIASKPRIMFLDEATSALDNITQKHVSDALDRLKSTRIVIAHRLSTIRQCDRILVLDKGRIAEDGTYDELIEKHGIFADLVERQQLDAPGGDDQ